MKHSVRPSICPSFVRILQNTAADDCSSAFESTVVGFVHSTKPPSSVQTARARARSQTKRFHVCVLPNEHPTHKHTHAQCAKSPAHIVHTLTHTCVHTNRGIWHANVDARRDMHMPCQQKPAALRSGESVNRTNHHAKVSLIENAAATTHTHTRAHAINKRCQSAPLFPLRCRRRHHTLPFACAA